MDPEDIIDPLHRWQNVRHVVNRHPVTVRRKGKDHVTVHIPFPLTPPDTPPEAYRTVDVTCTLTPADLYAFATLPPIVLADVMTAYLAQAARVLWPPAPRRKTPATLLKWEASREARRMYPTIKWLRNEWPRLYPETPHSWFPDLQAAVQRSLGSAPTASDITAWVIERLFAPAWEQSRLAKPTALANFAKDYLYTRRESRRREYMPCELEARIRPLLP